MISCVQDRRTDIPLGSLLLEGRHLVNEPRRERQVEPIPRLWTVTTEALNRSAPCLNAYKTLAVRSRCCFSRQILSVFEEINPPRMAGFAHGDIKIYCRCHTHNTLALDSNYA